VATDPLSISGREHSFQQIVNFDLQGDDIHTSPVAIDVNVELGVHRIEREFRIPVSLSDEEDFTASPPFLAVSVLLPVNFKGQFEAVDLKAIVSVPVNKPFMNRMAAKPEVMFVRDFDTGIAIKQVNPEEVILLRKTGKK
jgi:hypothetical protein